MKSEKKIKDMYDTLMTIYNDRRYRASQMICYPELETLKWVLGDDDNNWHVDTIEMYTKKTKV